MRRWFLSYNSQDFELAQRLAAELTRNDADATIFFAPKSLRPGAYWMPALAKAIAEATGFVLLVAHKGLGPWQTIEYLEAFDRRARERDFPVILVLLDGAAAPGLPFLGQLDWIITKDPASEISVTKLMEAAAGVGVPAVELWRHTAPYRGLSAMIESDGDFFFGRDRETAEAVGVLATMPDRLPLLLGNSGVGKSSLAQAGVLAALLRQGWSEAAETVEPWPQAFHDSRGWCVLKLKPGADPVRALVEPFLWTWQFDAVDPKRVEIQSNWVERLICGTVSLRDLLDATQARYRDELHREEPPAFLLYIDQGEELYTRAEALKRRRFSEIIADALPDARLRIMMSMRSDFLGELQKDAALYAVHRQINVPPLREPELRKVVSRPAELLSARFENPGLVDIITRHTVEDSVQDVGALPLLSYTLDDMWTQMVQRGDGTLRLPIQSFELGGVLIDRAEKFLATHLGAEDSLRRMLTLRFATLHEGGEPTRRRAPHSEFSEAEWRLVSELADDPYRLLVTITTENGETYAEVAHEVIFRRWEKLRGWIATERQFLIWKSGLEAARHVWLATPDHAKNDALLMGLALEQAKNWLAKRSQDIVPVDRNFILLSLKGGRRRKLLLRGLVGCLIAALLAGLAAWKHKQLKDEFFRVTAVQALTRAQMLDKRTFSECTGCPDMVVVDPGSFIMGATPNEGGLNNEEGPNKGTPLHPEEQPQHNVTINYSFAVSKSELTFDQWAVCVSYGGCNSLSTNSFGGGPQPVISVTWTQANDYVKWLNRVTGGKYRLLTEAEYEYAARAKTQTAYWWGDDAGTGHANCNGCDGTWNQRPAPVGSYPANPFGLDDMLGNVWEWVQDCWHDDYSASDIPTNGSAWATDDCDARVLRGGSWADLPIDVRSASRDRWSPTKGTNGLGFRVALTLPP
jgi:formylglycine-generating enzyme required for sulfatase activity